MESQLPSDCKVKIPIPDLKVVTFVCIAWNAASLVSYAVVDKVWKMNMKEDERFQPHHSTMDSECPFSKNLHRYNKGDKKVLSSRQWSSRNTLLVVIFFFVWIPKVLDVFCVLQIIKWQLKLYENIFIF